MPLGLPPHLATRATGLAVARAGHVAAAVCLIGVGVIVVSIQAYLPDLVVWPALMVLLPMIVLLALLDRTPTVFIAASYLVIGGICVFWFTLIASTQLDTPVANDDYTIVLLKLALILVIGAGPRLGASVLWTTAGLLTGEGASFGALLWLGAPWRVDATTIAVWFVVVGLLLLLRLDLMASRDVQRELYRAARAEMLADVRRVFESRATALLHDTVLNQLAVITTTQGDLPPAARAVISADLATIVGHEWFSVQPAVDAPADVRGELLRASIDDAGADVVTASLSGDESALGRLSGEAFDELSRAIAQCIANVRRHADTDTAEVVIGASATEVSAMVIDGGRGFVNDGRADGRLGVGTSIVGRLATVGGSAVVWSQPGKGTSVLLRVPAHEVEPPA